MDKLLRWEEAKESRYGKMVREASVEDKKEGGFYGFPYYYIQA